MPGVDSDAGVAVSMSFAVWRVPGRRLCAAVGWEFRCVIRWAGGRGVAGVWGGHCSGYTWGVVGGDMLSGWRALVGRVALCKPGALCLSLWCEQGVLHLGTAVVTASKTGRWGVVVAGFRRCTNDEIV